MRLLLVEVVRAAAIVVILFFSVAMAWENVCDVARLEGFDVSRFVPAP